MSAANLHLRSSGSPEDLGQNNNAQKDSVPASQIDENIDRNQAGLDDLDERNDLNMKAKASKLAKIGTVRAVKPTTSKHLEEGEISDVDNVRVQVKPGEDQFSGDESEESGKFRLF